MPFSNASLCLPAYNQAQLKLKEVLHNTLLYFTFLWCWGFLCNISKKRKKKTSSSINTKHLYLSNYNSVLTNHMRISLFLAWKWCFKCTKEKECNVFLWGTVVCTISAHAATCKGFWDSQIFFLTEAYPVLLYLLFVSKCDSWEYM